MTVDVVHAAGGVLWRRTGQRVELAVIHRPRYDDWTLPKGKLDPGEDHATAALREVEEETGHRGVLGAELGDIRYVQKRSGRRLLKIVRYWAMEAAEGSFVPGDEVDVLEWLPPGPARVRMSYDRDRAVLDRFAGLGIDGRP